jgi:hypothetical protein
VLPAFQRSRTKSDPAIWSFFLGMKEGAKVVCHGRYVIFQDAGARRIAACNQLNQRSIGADDNRMQEATSRVAHRCGVVTRTIERVVG